jgi:HPt (histidine-containing phosphotransfer) domain-containing protein
MVQPRDVEPAVNFHELLSRVDNDPELLQELLTIFKQEFPGKLQSLQNAVAQGDVKQVESIGHNLKGMLSNLSVARAVAAAARLELMARAGETLGLTDVLALLEGEVAELLPEIDAYLEKAKP